MSAPLSPGEPSPLVYIAASARDGAAFEAVRRALTEAGISCGGAPRHLPPNAAIRESLAREIVAAYPTPIAFVYERFYKDATLDHQLETLFNALKATLLYLTTLAVADLLSGLALEEGEAAHLPDRIEFEVL